MKYDYVYDFMRMRTLVSLDSRMSTFILYTISATFEMGKCLSDNTKLADHIGNYFMPFSSFTVTILKRTVYRTL